MPEEAAEQRDAATEAGTSDGALPLIWVLGCFANEEVPDTFRAAAVVPAGMGTEEGRGRGFGPGWDRRQRPFILPMDW